MIHCSECDSCVEQMDHHCPFISTCVGRRNYKWFFLFVHSIWVDSVFIFGLTCVDMHKKIQALGWQETMQTMPLSIPVSVLSGAALVLLSALIGFHFKIKSKNETTFEQHKKTFGAFEQSPFRKRTWYSNLRIAVCIKKPKRPVFEPRALAYDNDG